MIVDIHTHIFPPEFIAQRDRLAQREPVFGEMYANPTARTATAEDLLGSMEEAGVDVSVACGVWWGDPGLAREHADYLVDAARTSDGRLLAFVPTPESIEGAHGIGEVRVRDASAFPETTLPVLAHCSEEVGHAYPGKAGGLSAGALWNVLESRPAARVIAAHLGAGFPFFALMPEVRALLEADRVIFDTAAAAYLYRREGGVYRALIDLVGPLQIAWGSDYPLRPQRTDLAEVRAALPEDARDLVLGGNAARFLGLALGEQ